MFFSAMGGKLLYVFFYVILSCLGFDVDVPTTALQDFCDTPLPTNVYTVLFPYYKDFGFTGIALFALLEGGIIGALYKSSKTGNNIAKYLYAYIFTLLMMQFVDEQIFQGLSSIIQMSILLLICHTKFSFNKNVERHGG